MPTSFAIMAATADPTITERAVAIAATIPDLSEQKVRSRIRELVTTPLEGGRLPAQPPVLRDSTLWIP